jgi:hypothetical protein
MSTRQGPIRVREMDWGAPAVALPAAQEEEEARPTRSRPCGQGRGCARGRGRDISASQPVLDSTSMLDDDSDGDLEFDTGLHS